MIFRNLPLITLMERQVPLFIAPIRSIREFSKRAIQRLVKKPSVFSKRLLGKKAKTGLRRLAIRR
jgi:hypothetical protein